MINATINTLVRNGDDFLKPCLESVLPYVSEAIVFVDSRSTDKTREVLYGLGQEYHNLSVFEVEINKAKEDLVKARNMQLAASRKTEWIWIVDSDEFYLPETIEEIMYWSSSPHKDVLALPSWAIWNKEYYHVSTSKIYSGRLFRNYNKLEWRGKFGKEKLFWGEKTLWNNQRSEVKFLDSRYIHFTHVKKDKWREEMGQLRRADNRNLRPLSPALIEVIKNVYENKM